MQCLIPSFKVQIKAATSTNKPISGRIALLQESLHARLDSGVSSSSNRLPAILNNLALQASTYNTEIPYNTQVLVQKVLISRLSHNKQLTLQ